MAKLGRLISAPVRTGRTPKSRAVKAEEPCVRFIKTDTVREGSIDFDNSALIPKRVINQRDYIPNDALVITIIGATPEIVGRTAIVRPADPLCVTNQNVAVVTTNDICDPYFLAAYFQTNWGRDQLWRHSRRTGQVNLNCREVERVLVPRPAEHTQRVIGNLVRDSFASGDRATELCQTAQRLLDIEIGLDRLTFQKPIGFIAPLSEAITFGRIDADYFQPQHAVIRSLIKAYSGGYESLADCCSPLRPNIDPSKFPKQPFEYIELSNINSSIGTVNGSFSALGNQLPSRARRQVRTGDVIASAVVGSIDKAAIISGEQDYFIASTGFFHLRPSTVPSEYLLMLVRSLCVRMQFQQEATGGILSAVPDSRLKYVIVPKLPGPVQQKIARLIMDSHAAKRESITLLDQAKIRVEQLIEEAV
jgi:type I restriction enzyme S subunit